MSKYSLASLKPTFAGSGKVLFESSGFNFRSCTIKLEGEVDRKIYGEI